MTSYKKIKPFINYILLHINDVRSKIGEGQEITDCTFIEIENDKKKKKSPAWVFAFRLNGTACVLRLLMKHSIKCFQSLTGAHNFITSRLGEQSITVRRAEKDESFN